MVVVVSLVRMGVVGQVDRAVVYQEVVDEAVLVEVDIGILLLLFQI